MPIQTHEWIPTSQPPKMGWTCRDGYEEASEPVVVYEIGDLHIARLWLSEKGKVRWEDDVDFEPLNPSHWTRLEYPVVND